VCFFLLLLRILHVIIPVVDYTDGVTTVKLEEGMVQECVCPWEGSLAMVSWTKLIRFDKVPIAVYHPEYELSISQSYQTRIQFLKTTPMDGSITITNVTQEDTGVYHCSVQTFPRGSWYSLHAWWCVGEGDMVGHLSPNVFGVLVTHQIDKKQCFYPAYPL
uniref:Ig-like domain-containing protein n=1 Tax=Oncorhynchus mykiss TaxID=8022 RepID=A0A8K9ULG8_ONCMY